ncbi:TAXI family TRAP transporter solute-binding subunit [Marinomonas sp. C2222]|uniref:TAXI family TRAP transporter solute-binding subunit n=1 Tax=Marinomonas sargassi TaxID=2984494 RepID=A0ABT2YVF1_9GAMM|nr:TAXI family TRAP transporter solute-binding subunit [Marinomonas sargassi]MCV2403559.1 TAXI family TRAP transporter solute-binding subunit [Marinomonas sargassi]
MLSSNKIAGALFSALIGFSSSAIQAADPQRISIGTGGVTGVYFPAGTAICKMINQDRRTHGIRCSAKKSGGSIDNINTIRQGDIEFGIIQSDIQAAAVEGTQMFEGKAYGNLRSIFSLHPEPIHLMTRSGSGINSFDDLAGKRVNIGNSGSGHRNLMELLMTKKGWTNQSFAKVSELDSSKQAKALCNDGFDAAFWAAGLPNASAQQATISCNISIVPVAGDAVDAVLADNPAYSSAVIPGGMYRGHNSDVASFGSKGTLVTAAEVPYDTVYLLVKSVFDDFEAFKQQHPAFQRLTPQDMVKDSLVAPLHPAAAAFYKEKGWL